MTALYIFRSLLALLMLCLILPVTPHFVQADDGQPPTMQQSSDRVRGYLWNDSNCDGVRQSTEDAMPDSPTGGYNMSLFYIGNDGIPFTMDDDEIGPVGSANGNIMYRTSDGGGGNTYFIAIRPASYPAGFVPSPYQVGDDRSIDNDMKVWERGIWATTTFVIPMATGYYGGPPAITGIDIGLCPTANIVRPYSIALPLVLH